MPCASSPRAQATALSWSNGPASKPGLLFVIARLIAINDSLRPILVATRDEFERFERYGPLFRKALEQLLAGDQSWFTSPMIESYHTVWFELHEDFLATLGIDRASEGST